MTRGGQKHGRVPSCLPTGCFRWADRQDADDWVGPTRSRYGVRFTKQVWPGDTLTAKGEVTAVENGVATIKVVTTNQNGESVVEGEALAQA